MTSCSTCVIAWNQTNDLATANGIGSHSTRKWAGDGAVCRTFSVGPPSFAARAAAAVRILLNLWMGVNLLERINTFFFSDMEDRVLKRHIEELKAGHVIMVFEAPTDRVDEAARIADQHGVRRLVHFGLTTVTWHTK